MLRSYSEVAIGGFGDGLGRSRRNRRHRLSLKLDGILGDRSISDRSLGLTHTTPHTVDDGFCFWFGRFDLARAVSVRWRFASYNLDRYGTERLNIAAREFVTLAVDFHWFQRRRKKKYCTHILSVPLRSHARSKLEQARKRAYLAARSKLALPSNAQR